MSGTGTLNKTDTGTLTLSSANTYSGGTRLTGGTIALGASSTVSGGAVSSGPLGTGTLVLGDGTTLRSSSTKARTINNNLSLSGVVTFGDATNTGILTFDNSTLTTKSTVLTADTTLAMASSATINNAISGNGINLAKTGLGYLELGGVNTFSGGYTANGGNTYLDFNGALGSVAFLTVASGAAVISENLSQTNLINDAAAVTLNGSMDLSGGTETLGSLAGTNTSATLNIGDYTSTSTTPSTV